MPDRENVGCMVSMILDDDVFEDLLRCCRMVAYEEIEMLFGNVLIYIWNGLL